MPPYNFKSTDTMIQDLWDFNFHSMSLTELVELAKTQHDYNLRKKEPTELIAQYKQVFGNW
tara:strand:- start:588 stop:770 length:183 start_codon:yes stop_codon:yes gene_type:complete